jgi:hypothetical protein
MPYLTTERAKTLLELAPHGFLVGCGGTSEFLAYILRVRPDDDTLIRIWRQHEYYDFFSEIDFKSYSFPSCEEFNTTWSQAVMDEVAHRLNSRGYVRFSFRREEPEATNSIPDLNEITTSLVKIIRTRPKPKLFDHSFVIAWMDSPKGYVRLESYIDQYHPRMVIWNSYQEDLSSLINSVYQINGEPEKIWQ